MHSAFQDLPHYPEKGLRIQGNLLPFLRHLEQVFPEHAVSLISLYHAFRSRIVSPPSFLYEYPFRQIFEPFSIYFSHLPLRSLSFPALRNSFLQFSPSLFPIGEFTHSCEQEFREAGGTLIEGSRARSFLYRGLLPTGVSTEEGESYYARTLFLGNSSFLQERLQPFCTSVSPFLAYGILKSPVDSGISFIFRVFDKDFPPVEQNFFFAFLLPWAKGEAEYPETRVIFGYLSREDLWASSGEKVEKRYRTTLLEAVEECVGKVDVLQFLTPLEIRNHPLYHTFPTPSYLPGEVTFSRWMKYRSAFPPGCKVLVSPEMMTGETGAWMRRAERLALPHLKVPL